MRRLVLTMLCFAAGACTVGPDYTPPEISGNAGFSGIADDNTRQLRPGDKVDENWWLSFEDPVLAGLVDQTLQANTDLRQATARLEEARALSRATAALSYPSLNGDASAARQRQSEGGTLPPGAPVESSIYEAGLGVAWEIDLVGRLRRATQAADARLEASAAERRGVALMLVAETASAYGDLVYLRRQLDIARENIAIAQKTVELTGLLESQQLAAELDLVRARADLKELRTTLTDLKDARRQTAVRLAILTGRQPARAINELLETDATGLATPAVPVGLASDLLRRRPDVIAAERRLAAATADIGVETADLFPRFSLTGAVSTLATDVSELFSSTSETWSFAGMLQWPIFDGGRQRAQIDAAEARRDAAFAAYDGAVLDALGDAEQAFSAYVFAAQKVRQLEGSLGDRQRALKLARLRYENDLDDLFPVLEAQRHLQALTRQIAEAEAGEAQAVIGVYRALGGGWEAARQHVP